MNTENNKYELAVLAIKIYLEIHQSRVTIHCPDLLKSERKFN